MAADPLPDATTGRHPLPSEQEFAADMSAAGIGNDTHVVVYDDAGGANAARLWWLLRYFGHDSVSLLDGGLKWQALGLSPADSRGRLEVTAIRVPVEISGVQINDGDLIVADLDGCIAVPQAIEDEVFERALKKVSAENVVRDILSKGASIQQVFREYGVL